MNGSQASFGQDRFAGERQSRPHYEMIERTLAAGEGEGDLRPGNRVGPYQLVKQLDSGSFGQVWEARDTRSDTTAAVKIFDRTNFKGSELDAAERFCDGASAMARLRDKRSVIELYEGPSFDEDRGIVWFSMKYYPERDLALWSKRNDLTTAIRLALIGDLLEALRAAHGANPQIVHRDLRPKNILIDSAGETPHAVLIDFDIAYYEDMYRQRQSTVHPLGEPRYIPPDVGGAGNAIADKLRRASNDLYALTVVTLDLFTGGGLQLDSTPQQIAVAIERQNPKDLDPWFRKSLATFLHRGLRPSEDGRFRDIAEYERAWRVVTDPGRAAKNAIGVAALVLTPSLLILADWSWCRWRESLLFGVLGTTSAIVGGGAFAVLLAWATSFVRSFASDFQQRLLAFVLARQQSALVALAAFALSTVIGAAMTQPLTRAAKARLIFATECVGVDESESATFVGPSPLDFQVPIKEVRCTAEGSESAEILGSSILTPLPTLRRLEHPRCKVQVKRLMGRIVEYSIGALSKQARIRGIKEPIRHPGWHELKLPNPPAIQQVTMILGYGGDVELLANDQNLGQELIRKGLSFADESCSGEPQYQRAEADAKAAMLGVWQEHEGTGSKGQVACPGLCCPKGTACDQMTECSDRAKCLLCQLGEEQPQWRLKLAHVDFANISSWADVKVCLTTNGNDCGQACVNVENIGTPLAEFRCPYGSNDLRWVTFEVLGTRLGTSSEVRIAQKITWFNTLSASTYCTGLRVKNLEPKKDSVQGVSLTATVRPANALGNDTGPLRVVVERGETRTRDARHAYHYRLDATDDALKQVVEVSIESYAKGSSSPMNGPIAWKGCRVNGTQTWVPVGDGLARSCDQAVFQNACECRFVLTSGACPPRNVMSFRFRDGRKAQAEFDACSAVGEVNGELQGLGHKFDLERALQGGWSFQPLDTERTMSCGLNCGPPAAGRQ